MQESRVVGFAPVLPGNIVPAGVEHIDLAARDQPQWPLVIHRRRRLKRRQVGEHPGVACIQPALPIRLRRRHRHRGLGKDRAAVDGFHSLQGHPTALGQQREQVVGSGLLRHVERHRADADRAGEGYRRHAQFQPHPLRHAVKKFPVLDEV